MFGTYIGNNQMLVKTAYNGMLKISANDISIMPILVTTGSMEIPLTQYIINTVKAGMTVVDIGANVGYFTVLLGMLVGDKGKVYGFEANSKLCPILKENVAINWISHRVTIFEKAVYSENKIISFNTNDIDHGGSSIHLIEKEEEINAYRRQSEVEAITLSEILNEVPSIDFLKIDIEGGEYHAFLGMMELFEKGKVKTVSFEWNRMALGNDALLFIDTLNTLQCKYNAEFYVLDGAANLIPSTIFEITSNDFYPFAIIKF